MLNSCCGWQKILWGGVLEGINYVPIFNLARQAMEELPQRSEVQAVNAHLIASVVVLLTRLPLLMISGTGVPVCTPDGMTIFT